MTKRLFACAFALCTVLYLLPAIAQSGNSGSVANATFTSDIVDGAPVDFRQEFFNTTPVVYYYSELLDLAGQTVVHRWSLEGKVMQEVRIRVTRARQPAWSRNKMQPEWTGNWTVEVVNEKGELLDTANFAYSPM